MLTRSHSTSANSHHRKHPHSSHPSHSPYSHASHASHTSHSILSVDFAINYFFWHVEGFCDESIQLFLVGFFVVEVHDTIFAIVAVYFLSKVDSSDDLEIIYWSFLDLCSLYSPIVLPNMLSYVCAQISAFTGLVKLH